MNLAIIIFKGSKSADLLQGQSSCNIKQLSPTEATMGSFSLANGKSYATFIAHKPNNEAVHLIVNLDLSPIIETQLQKYLPFFKVTLQILKPAINYIYIAGNNNKPNNGKFTVSQNNDLYKINIDDNIALEYTTASQNKPQPASDNWQNHWFKKGLALLNQKNSLLFTPNMLNYDLHSGVDFKKGCYTGQEIIARSHYKGKVKRRLKLVKFADHQTEMPLLTDILHNNEVVGSLIATTASQPKLGYAIIKTDINEASILGVQISCSDFVYVDN